MRDPRYSTAAWQKLRKAVLARDGGICQLEGPRCTGYATTVHHRVPSSQAPELFWEPRTLPPPAGAAATATTPRVAAQNTRRTIEDLRLFVEQQRAEIDRLIARLARYEHPKRPGDLLAANA